MNYYLISCHLFIVLLIINFCCSAYQMQNETELWKSFKNKHRKNYINQKQEDKKKETWSRKMKLIKNHNLRHRLGLETYSLAENSFIDNVCNNI